MARSVRRWGAKFSVIKGMQPARSPFLETLREACISQRP